MNSNKFYWNLKFHSVERVIDSKLVLRWGGVFFQILFYFYIFILDQGSRAFSLLYFLRRESAVKLQYL